MKGVKPGTMLPSGDTPLETRMTKELEDDADRRQGCWSNFAGGPAGPIDGGLRATMPGGVDDLFDLVRDETLSPAATSSSAAITAAVLSRSAMEGHFLSAHSGRPALSTCWFC